MTRVRNAPDATALMATARSFGNYDLAAALADVIDNAITANARTVDIECRLLDDGDGMIRIRDDGSGMSAEELVRAMCPASTHPEMERSADDLGRFGWGMKSASFSQCRILTVVTRKDGKTTAARWDLDNITNWEMDVFTEKDAVAFLERDLPEKSGTELIWTNCDRLTEKRELRRERFNELISSARRRLSQTFHRYLLPERGAKGGRLQITINGLKLDQLDPFCREHPATIPSHEEPIDIQLNGRTHRVTMQAYVVPHYSMLTAAQHEEFGGEEGFVRNQGFYVYRNRRLIISGTWFGLAKHGELSKLLRVRIDIPNSLDDLWKITIDKSEAQLPSALKARMKALVEGFRVVSHRVYRGRGARLGHGNVAKVWERHVRSGTIRYRINEDHPVCEAIFRAMPEESHDLVATFLEIIAAQVPVEALSRDVVENGDDVQQGCLSREELLAHLDAVIVPLMVEANTPSRLLARLLATEPFASHASVITEEIRRRFPHA